MRTGITCLTTYLTTFCFFVGIVFSPSSTAAIEQKELPTQLRGWIPWVLKDHKDHACPRLHNSTKQFQCVWTSALDLKVDKKQGQFSQQAEVIAESWVQIPGNGDNWPQNVKINGQSAIITVRNNLPAILLQKGSYHLTGTFHWVKLPEYVQLPKATGIVRFWLNNRQISFPNTDQNGRLWIQKTEKKDADQKQKFDLKIFRKLSDDIPMVISTHIILNYSGEADELTIGNPVINDFIPLSLESALPVRLKTDHTLHIQARPGKWVIQVNARSKVPRNELILEKPLKHWPGEEIWVFESKNHLRETKISGGQIIDPQQTDLPGHWKNLPAFHMKPGDRFRIEEIKRGNPQPADNHLHLTRNIWLDFDGQGYVAKDLIEGTMNRDWHLLAKDTTALGRVSVNNKDRLITAYPNGLKGVEIRSRNINTMAESRIEPRVSLLSAVGWEHDFDQLLSNLHLPPGWKAWHVSGADSVKGSWISKWSLLDLFMVFIVFLSVVKLWGRRCGALTLVTLLLTFHLPGSPRWIWLHIIVSFALFQVFPTGWIKRLLNLYRVISVLVLLVIVLPFMVQQAREGLYPQLEKRGVSGLLRMQQAETDYFTEQADEPVAIKQETVQKESLPRLQRMAPTKKLGSMPLESASLYRQKFEEFDPNAKVQTGPGVPDWTWNAVHLQWNGPVEKDQMIRLIITPPWFNRIFSFVHALFWGLILIFIIGIRYGGGKGLTLPTTSWKDLFSIFGKGSAALFLLLLPFNQVNADIPSENLLNQLKTELLKPPKCAPRCAAVSKADVTVRNSNLLIRIEAHIQADTAFPLPDGMGQWALTNVWQNGKAVDSFSNDSANRLMIRLKPGRHQLQMQGVLENKNIIQVNFPLKPYHISVSAVGWNAEGVYQNRMVGNHIQLRKIRQASVKPSSAGTEFTDLPAFVRIERSIKLGTNWQVETTISRMSKPEDTIIIQLPLLDGESITSEQLKMVDGKAEIQLSPYQSQKTIFSVFKKSNRFQLAATKTTEWIEIWKIYVSPVWHARFSGIPEIHHRNQTDKYQPEWRPWPGETIDVEITRPTAVTGQTKTIDQTQLTFDVGRRTVNTELSFQLRSSMGGRHTVTVPENSKLRRLTINGNEHPFQQQDQMITFPVRPGTQNISLFWNQKKDLSLFYRSPEINLGTTSVNSSIQVNLPSERWILGVNGPILGPAVLFWGNMIVILFIAFGLGRLKLTPLKSWHWMVLAIGLSGVSIYHMLVFSVWMLAMGLRRRMDQDTNKFLFNLAQITLAALFIAAMFSLYKTIAAGLLGGPEMLITGNGSYYNTLNWYQDRSNEILPQVSVISAPILAYRIAMLAWALWLAFSLIKWLRWSWESYGCNGLWKKLGFFELFTRKEKAAPKTANGDKKRE